MFLIEGDGKAILYTGDIRGKHPWLLLGHAAHTILAEEWWVNSVRRHPVLIPYTYGRKRLDKLYLDTTFASSSNPLREFPSKAEGLAELLQKIEPYPEDTIFYFRAWTFGYEDVWVTLATALNTKVGGTAYCTYGGILMSVGPCGSISNASIQIPYELARGQRDPRGYSSMWIRARQPNCCRLS